MALNYDTIMNWPFEEVEQSYAVKDSILYALSVGFGHDPMDTHQLRFVFEETDFQVTPTMAVVLSRPGFWSRDPKTGLDWKKILHGEQGMTIHKPLPPSATVVAKTRITQILDKGEGKGALLFTERDLVDKSTGDKLATLTATSFARGNGGFGGPGGPQPEPHPIPDREPDQVCDFPTLSQSALLYRLAGADPNPLHANPEVATAAGFKMPILHGLCTYGVAGHALIKACCNYDATRLRSMNLRFSSPVYPGETIRTEMWKEDSLVSFRARVLQRDIVVLNNGRAEIAA